MRFINPFELLLLFRCINWHMDINMMEIGKTIKKKEKELKLKFYNNFK